MELEDRIIVAAPEGIELQMVLAGAGSRFIACAIDVCVEGLLIALAAIALLGLIGGGLARDLFAFAAFAATFPYYILFEVLADGRTPGMRLTHLRVVRAQGTPVDLPASSIRTLMRLIDWLPFGYLVGLVSILATRRNQRLGDLAAGTLVIRDAAVRRGRGRRRGPRLRRSRGATPTPPSDPSAESASPAGSASPAVAASPARATPVAGSVPAVGSTAAAASASGWDVSAIGAEELAIVRRFLERRESLDRRARARLAHRLAQGMRAKVAGVPPGLAAERFLEELVRVKGSR